MSEQFRKTFWGKKLVPLLLSSQMPDLINEPLLLHEYHTQALCD